MSGQVFWLNTQDSLYLIWSNWIQQHPPECRVTTGYPALVSMEMLWEEGLVCFHQSGVYPVFDRLGLSPVHAFSLSLCYICPLLYL